MVEEEVCPSGQVGVHAANDRGIAKRGEHLRHRERGLGALIGGAGGGGGRVFGWRRFSDGKAARHGAIVQDC